MRAFFILICIVKIAFVLSSLACGVNIWEVQLFNMGVLISYCMGAHHWKKQTGRDRRKSHSKLVSTFNQLQTGTSRPTITHKRRRQWTPDYSFSFYAKRRQHYNNQFINSATMESSYSQSSEEDNDSHFSFKRSSDEASDKKWGEGLWTQEQKLRYVAYINFNKDILGSKLLRRTSKIFKQMSQFIKTRNPSQCRSQNQKVYRRFKTTKKVVAAFKGEYGANRFNEAIQQLAKDPLIRMQVDSDGRLASCQSKHSGRERRMQDAAIQTDSGRILVQMTAEEFEQWKFLKSMGFNSTFIYQFNQRNDYAQFYM